MITAWSGMCCSTDVGALVTEAPATDVIGANRFAADAFCYQCSGMIGDKVFYAALPLFLVGVIVALVGVTLSDLGLQGTIWGWLALLVFDLLLALFAVFLSDYAADSRESEADPRVETAALAFGTLGPLGTHALWVVLRSGDAGLDVSDASIVGAVMHAAFPERAVHAYFAILITWSLLSFLLAFASAYDARNRRSDGGGSAYFFSLLLLVGGSLFLVPWLNGAALPRHELVEIAGRQASFVVLLSLAYAFVIHRVRIAKAAVRAAEQGAKIVRLVALGIAAALAVALIVCGLIWLALWLAGLAGPLFAALRLGADILLIAMLAAVVLFGLIAGVRWVATRVGSLRAPPRWVWIGAILLLALLPVLLTRGGGVADSGGEESSSTAASISIQAVDIACSGFHWQYGETDRITAPVGNCGVYDKADFLIAVGSATPRGGPSTEHPRALQRGWTLAGVIAAQAARRDRRARVFVLSRGIETSPLEGSDGEGPSIALLTGTTVPGGSNVDDTTLARDLARYIREHPDGMQHSLCELYAYSDGSPGRAVQLNCR